MSFANGAPMQRGRSMKASRASPRSRATLKQLAAKETADRLQRHLGGERRRVSTARGSRRPRHAPHGTPAGNVRPGASATWAAATELRLRAGRLRLPALARRQLPAGSRRHLRLALSLIGDAQQGGMRHKRRRVVRYPVDRQHGNLHAAHRARGTSHHLHRFRHVSVRPGWHL